MTDSQTSSPQPSDTRRAWSWMGIVAFAMLMVRPFAELPYGDDLACAHVGLNLVRSGHLLYNGWDAAMLLSHAYWGALFIRLFGFSFACLRFSTMPFALGAVGLCYLLVRQAGLKVQDATLVTLLFGLSPIFLPLSVSYMTDVPCLFFMFASLYSLSKAATSSEFRNYGWLALGVATGFLGCTGRHVAWLVPLVVLPYLSSVKRRQTTTLAVSLTAWIRVPGVSVCITRGVKHQF